VHAFRHVQLAGECLQGRALRAVTDDLDIDAGHGGQGTQQDVEALLAVEPRRRADQRPWAVPVGALHRELGHGRLDDGDRARWQPDLALDLACGPPADRDVRVDTAHQRALDEPDPLAVRLDGQLLDEDRAHARQQRADQRLVLARPRRREVDLQDVRTRGRDDAAEVQHRPHVGLVVDRRDDREARPGPARGERARHRPVRPEQRHVHVRPELLHEPAEGMLGAAEDRGVRVGGEADHAAAALRTSAPARPPAA
jgi:hypothetical protein